MFANYKNGKVSIDTYRYVDAVSTDIADIRGAVAKDSKEILTANVEAWIRELDSDINDMLEQVIEREFGLHLYDYPDLRDIIRDAQVAKEAE